MKLVFYIAILCPFRYWPLVIFLGGGGQFPCSLRVLLNREMVQVISTIQVGFTKELKQIFHSCKKFSKVLENFTKEKEF